MKVLITGGLGFIFSYVTEYFVSKGYEVVVIDNKSTGSHPEIVDHSFRFYELDMSKRESVDCIIDERPDFFIHAAAITDVDFSIEFPYETLVNNITSTLNAFEAARVLKNLKKFLYVNTDEVYGECEYRKRETEILFTRNPYSASKAVGSLLRIAYDNSYTQLRYKTTEIRMCNIFGRRQDKRKIMPQLISSVKSAYSVPLQNNGEGYREYMYVENIPSLIEYILSKGDRIYNVTLNEGFTVIELIRIVEKLSGKKVFYHHSERPGHDKQYQMDNSRITKLGWHPLYKFESGLRKYVHDELDS